jgi:RNA polymerase sigma factor (sigma-70 family)
VSEADAMDLAEALRRLAVSRGDETAWTVLHNSLWPYVFAVAYRELGGASRAAEDVAQETFLRLVRYAPFPRLQDPSDMRAYVSTVARHVAHDVARREARRPELPGTDERLDEFSRSAPAPSRLLGPLLAEGALEQVRELLEPQEVALLDLVARGEDTRGVARNLGIRYGAAAVRIHRLRNKLRKLLLT